MTWLVNSLFTPKHPNTFKYFKFGFKNHKVGMKLKPHSSRWACNLKKKWPVNVFFFQQKPIHLFFHNTMYVYVTIQTFHHNSKCQTSLNLAHHVTNQHKSLKSVHHTKWLLWIHYMLLLYLFWSLKVLDPKNSWKLLQNTFFCVLLKKKNKFGTAWKVSKYWHRLEISDICDGNIVPW